MRPKDPSQPAPVSPDASMPESLLDNPNKRVITRDMHADRVLIRHDISMAMALNVMASMPHVNVHNAWRQQFNIDHAKTLCRDVNPI